MTQSPADLNMTGSKTTRTRNKLARNQASYFRITFPFCNSSEKCKQTLSPCYFNGKKVSWEIRNVC